MSWECFRLASKQSHRNPCTGRAGAEPGGCLCGRAAVQGEFLRESERVVCIHICIYRYIYMHMCTLICTYVYTYAYLYVYMVICVYCICLNMYIYIYTYIHIHIHMHIYTHIHIHTHIHIDMYIYIYTYTFARSSRLGGLHRPGCESEPQGEEHGPGDADADGAGQLLQDAKAHSLELPCCERGRSEQGRCWGTLGSLGSTRDD